MVVHAHPDDEASTTGGILARYAAEGVRTVLVTCTDGRMGDTADGRKPGEPGHDPDRVAAARADELAASCRALGVEDVVTLGHHDSGSDGSRPWVADCFSRADPAPVVDVLHRLMQDRRVDVVVTYAADGGSGHPDHVRTHDVTTAAFHRYAAGAARDGWPRLFHVALSRSRLADIRDRVHREVGPDAWAPPLEMGVDDALVTAAVDVAEHWQRKRDAIDAHASQPDARALSALFALAGEGGRVEEFVQAWPEPPPGRAVMGDLFA